MKLVFSLFLTVLLLSTVFLTVGFFNYTGNSETPEDDLYFGVTYGGNTTSEAKLLIDKVKGYTNLFIVASWDISQNESALNEICQYAVDSGMSVIVYFDYVFFDVEPWLWLQSWFETAQVRWGAKFLGVYLYDEPGGNQIDSNQWRSGPSAKRAMENASDYSDAAARFVKDIPSTISWQNVEKVGLRTFTSDYALYWFDYLAGYDTVFVELGWNHSRAQHIGLCRGAARAQEKEWGAIITWTNYDPPYLASGPEILEDLMIAYETGAKYIIVLDYPTYPETDPDGVLSDKHFAAMERFWNRIHAFPENMLGKVKGEVAFVLPKDYGWGMRWLDDSIWGLWSADTDSLSPAIWEKMTKLIERYGLQLDILYDNPRFSFDEYSEVYYWDSDID